jgi:hypothetical protein
MSEQEVQTAYPSVRVQYNDSVPALNPQDLTELGALLASNGLTVLEARALVAEVQQMAAQAALGMAPKLLEKIRQIQEARFMSIYTQIRLLNHTMGYVSRDRVLAIIQSVAAQPPRQ